MKSFLAPLLMAAVILHPLAPLQAADITGKWNSEFDTQIGHLKYVYDLKVDGEKLTGKAIRERDSEKSETEIKEGKITGNQVSFVENVKVQDQEVRIEYDGKIAGDEIKFTRKVVDFATLEITAKRQKPAQSVTGKWKAEFDAPVGHLKYLYDLKADGTKLTGKAFRDRDGQKSEGELQEGKVKGDEISFVDLVKVQDQELRIEYKGKLAGDEIKFSRKVGDFDPTEIVARRVKDSEAK